MAWMTFEELASKGGVQGVQVNWPFGDVSLVGSNLAALNKNEKGALLELYGAATSAMSQLNVAPTGGGQRQVSLGDGVYDSVTVPTWDFGTIQNTLNGRNIKLAYDPSRDKGNWGSSRSHSIQLGVLDAAGNPVQEYRVGEGSIGSMMFKQFIVPFAQIALTANASAIGAAIAPTASATVQSAIGSAVASGAGTALAGGDAEDVIKNALTGGAVGAASSLVKPYIQDAIDFVKDLAPSELEQIASSVDATAGATGDVANNLAGVEVGGANVGGTILNNAYPEEGAIRLARYNDLRAMGMPHDVAFAQVASELGQSGAITAPATGNVVNALTPSFGALEEAGNLGGYQEVGFQDVTPTTPAGGIATVETNALAERPLAGSTLPAAGTTGAGLGTAAAGAGALGAGALGAGAAGTVGGGLTVPAGAGLGEAGAITTPGGLDAIVAGGGGITAGTTGGGGLDTGGLALGGALGAGAAAGSALPVGSAAAAGSAITPAAGLTGIKAVDDFLSYLGTPAGAMALSAFGGLAGGYFQGQAAKEAAQTQATAAQNALALQREMFEYQKGLLEPYQQAGTAALGRLTGVMGLGGQTATGGQQLLEMDPGYAFRLGEGMKALERLQAARGNMLSGGAIKAGQRYAQDVASQEYGSAYNRLANIAGLGQTTGAQLGAAGQQFGSAAGETLAQQANALAAGRVGRTSAYTQGINTAANAFANFANQQQQNQLFRDIYGRAFGD
jgi:hypothetical protein